MTALFVDTTYDISIGLLDHNLEWLEHKKFSGQKVSNVLQTETHVMLQRHGLKLRQITKIITTAGPGFYTGLRLSEGFADVLHFAGIEHVSFLTYHIPRLVGISSGCWVTKAYRGEYLFHHWDGDRSQDKLVASRDLAVYCSSLSSVYIHSESAIDDLLREQFPNRIAADELLKSHPREVFKGLIGIVPSYYFRAPEDEFKVAGA